MCFRKNEAINHLAPYAFCFAVANNALRVFSFLVWQKYRIWWGSLEGIWGCDNGQYIQERDKIYSKAYADGIICYMYNIILYIIHTARLMQMVSSQKARNRAPSREVHENTGYTHKHKPKI